VLVGMTVDLNKTYTEFKMPLPVSGRSASVTVYHDKAFGSTDERVEVNWSAMGSSAPDDARAYAALIEQAAVWALMRQAANMGAVHA
jgi:hypothetical protein